MRQTRLDCCTSTASGGARKLPPAMDEHRPSNTSDYRVDPDVNRGSSAGTQVLSWARRLSRYAPLNISSCGNGDVFDNLRVSTRLASTASFRLDSHVLSVSYVAMRFHWFRGA